MQNDALFLATMEHPWHTCAVDLRIQRSLAGVPREPEGPRPLFTEEARKNKIQGVVRVKVLVDATGTVREVIVTRGLPDGLSEQAIRAAYEMRFRPAMKDGRPVSYWLNSVEVEFNLR